MDVAELRDLFKNPNAAELELVARFAELEGDAARGRAFRAFALTGLPNRRIEGWKWSDVKAALPQLESESGAPVKSPFAAVDGPRIRFDGHSTPETAVLPKGVRAFLKDGGQAFGGAEDMPLGALTAALSNAPDALMVEVTEKVEQVLHLEFIGIGKPRFSRIVVVVRPGAHLTVIESHLGGAPFSGTLLEYGVQENGTLNRIVFQAGDKSEVQSVSAAVHLGAGAKFSQTSFATGARIARMETRLVHQGEGAHATVNGAYLVKDGHHVDYTSHVRHGAADCQTRQVTKGAARKGGRGVFQGKFFVARVAQRTDADMQHNALLLEDGAEVNAKPELEIYADDVACAHGNTSGALDTAALFYMRQRGIGEREAKALLTEAHIAEAFDDIDRDDVRDVLMTAARDWLASVA